MGSSDFHFIEITKTDNKADLYPHIGFVIQS